MVSARLPPFSSLLKSREVEDPINLWVHRPLAYAFVALVYRTPITPNQITLIAALVGCAAGFCWVVGTPFLMLMGGILLWASAILDGADGILARAKQMQSALGRALDGAADAVVAIATVIPAFYRVWTQRQQPIELIFMAFALTTSLFHIFLYDYYREAFLHSTDPQWDGKPERIVDAQRRLDKLKQRRAPWTELIASKMYVDLITNQTRVVAFTNPNGSREHLRFSVSEESVSIYRRHNRGPMKLWPLISTAPHSYLMAICGMFDYLYLYLLFRVFVANTIFIAVMIWQRAASTRTMRDLEKLGASPVPVEP